MWSGGQHRRQPWQGSTDRVLRAPPNQRPIPKCIGAMRFFSTGETIVGPAVEVNQQNSTNRPSKQSKQSKHEILHSVTLSCPELIHQQQDSFGSPCPKRHHPLIHRLHHQHLLPITSHPPKPNHNQRHSQHKHQPNQHLTTPHSLEAEPGVCSTITYASANNRLLHHRQHHHPTLHVWLNAEHHIPVSISLEELPKIPQCHINGATSVFITTLSHLTTNSRLFMIACVPSSPPTVTGSILLV